MRDRTKKHGSEIIATVAIIISVIALVYTVRAHHFAKSELTLELHGYFIDNHLFVLSDDAWSRYYFDISFYNEHKEQIQDLFNIGEYYPSKWRIELPTSHVSEVSELLWDDYHDSLGDLEESQTLRAKTAKLLSFYNRLGILMQNDLLDDGLAAELFRDDFEIFFGCYLVPSAFLHGDFLRNQFYLYLTGLTHTVRCVKFYAFVDVSEKYEGVVPLKTLPVPLDGILFLADEWDCPYPDARDG